MNPLNSLPGMGERKGRKGEDLAIEFRCFLSQLRSNQLGLSEVHHSLYFITLDSR